MTSTHELAQANASLKAEISERKRVEEALQEYSQRLEKIVAERTSDLQEVQERLLRREKLTVLGQLAGGVGHELRNPLGVIANAVYFLQMTLSEADETTAAYLDIIATRVQEAEKIVADLLDLSRLQSAEREEKAIAALVNEALTRYPPPARVKVSNQVETDLPLVSVDPQQLRQVLANLISNAYQAMPAGGELIISARRAEDWVHLSIADTGSGIPQRTIKKIFDPLFTTKATGIGLGLSISKNLVELNQGSISVESAGGEGSTFTITLPLRYL